MSIPIQEDSWIDALPEPVKREVLSAMSPLNLSKGEYVYTQGSDSSALYRVDQGEVVISHVSPEGKEYVPYIVEAGDCFGELGLIDGLPRANNAYAQGDVKLKVLTRSEFWRLRGLHSEIADQLLLFVNHRLRLGFSVMENISLSSLAQQLALRLYLTASRYSLKKGDSHEITLKLSQEDLGKTLGVTRQSINKAMKTLSEANLIVMNGGRISVQDLKKLKEFSGQ